jgi:hypothetical protein
MVVDLYAMLAFLQYGYWSHFYRDLAYATLVNVFVRNTPYCSCRNRNYVFLQNKKWCTARRNVRDIPHSDSL